MIADLHTHTTASDGILRPDELVSRAKLHGVDLLAITDHDTLAGLPLAQEVAIANDIQLITGIELSCLWQGRGIHIVGLNVDLKNEKLLAGVEQQGIVREKRAKIIAERLEKAGIQGSYEIGFLPAHPNLLLYQNNWSYYGYFNEWSSMCVKNI